MCREVYVGYRVKPTAETLAYNMERKLLLELQVNCWGVYIKAIEFWNLVDVYNPDVVIGTESWLKEILAILKSSGLICDFQKGLPMVVWLISML
jgi:hypothetical protein